MAWSESKKDCSQKTKTSRAQDHEQNEHSSSNPLLTVWQCGMAATRYPHAVSIICWRSPRSAQILGLVTPVATEKAVLIVSVDVAGNHR